MRSFIVLLLLFQTGISYSQNGDSLVFAEFWKNDPRKDIWKVKWYLNAAQISSFGWNDTSSLITSVQSNSFIRFLEELEFGEDRDPEDLRSIENTFLPYRFYMEDSTYGNIETYQSKRKYRKGQDATYYDIVFNGYQLSLILNEASYAPLEDLGGIRSFVFSRYTDSLELTTKILGNWKPDIPTDFFDLKTSDTLVLRKLPYTSFYYPGYSYCFNLNDGDLKCSSECFNLDHEEGIDYLRISYYDTKQIVSYAIDIGKQQLHLFGKSNKTFDILELNEHQLILKTVE